ncbi:MAG: hypothetical protein IJW08_10020, partial [Lentisphaeria bacterium]|nr:hypothetical protein [Lentisphaeria bacterium]
MKNGKANLNSAGKRQGSSFTLIELLVSKTCQICVSPLYYFQKSTPLFLKGERGAGREGNLFSRETRFP